MTSTPPILPTESTSRGAPGRAGYESDKFRLAVYDRETKTTKELRPKFENWVDEFAWAPIRKARFRLWLTRRLRRSMGESTQSDRCCKMRSTSTGALRGVSPISIRYHERSSSGGVRMTVPPPGEVVN